MKLLGVREAASQLGVHENTLRRWEEAGLIRAVKLPTGVRRFQPEEVDRVRSAMLGDADESDASGPPQDRSSAQARES
jgi:excisionase family DNA binding protein